MAVIKKFDPGGKFTYNKLTKDYKVEGTKDFEGTKEKIGKTLFGKWNPKTQEEFNSLAATIYSELLDSYGNTLSKEEFKGKARDILESFHIKNSAINETTDNQLAMETVLDKLIDHTYTPHVNKSKTQVTMPGLDYLNYGSPEAYERDFSGLTNEQKTPIIVNHIKSLAEKYLTGSKQYPQWNYSQAGDAQAIVDLFANGQSPSLETLLPYAYKFGWSPNSHLRSAEELKAEAEEKVKQETAAAAALKLKQDQDAKTNTVNSYIASGLSPDVAQYLVENNYTETDNITLPSQYNNLKVAELVRNWISSKNGKIYQTPQGKQLFLNAEGHVNMPTTIFDEFSPARGLIWQHDENNNVVFGSSPNPTKKFNTQRVNLNWNPGKGFENYKLRGTVQINPDGTFAENPWGWLNTLELYTPGNEQIPTILNRKTDGSYFSINAQGKEQPYDINLTGYGDEVPDDVNSEVGTKWAEYVPINAPDQLEGSTFETDYALVKRALDKNEYGGLDDKEAVKRLAYKVKHNLFPNPTHTQAAKELLTRYYNATQISVNKIGGILRGQKGLTFKEYQEKFKRPAAVPETESSGKKGFGNLEGTWKSMGTAEKALRTASIAGDVGAFVPVYGAIGAGTTLVTDVLADVVKDGFQWQDIFNMNTALNAGVVGLSLIGLGGTKAFIKASKIASEGIKFTDVAAKAKKYQKALNLTDDGVEAITDLARIGKDFNLKTTSELTAKVLELEKAGANIGKAADGIDLLQQVANSSTKIQTVLQSLGNQVGKVASSKSLRYGLTAGAMIPGGMAAIDQIPTALKYGLEYTKPAELKKMAITGAVGRNLIKDIKGVNALKNQLVENTIGENKTTFKIGNQEFLVPTNIVKPDLLKTKWYNPRTYFKNMTKGNEQLLDNYKQSILKEVQKTPAGKDLKIEDLKDLKLEDFIREQQSGTGKYMLPLLPQSTTQNRFKDVRQYELAKKYWIGKTKLPKIEKELAILANKKVISKNPNLINANLEEEVKAMQKTMSKYKRPSKPGNKILAKRKQQLEEYNKLQLQILNQKKGGILKYQNPHDSVRQRFLKDNQLSNPFSSSFTLHPALATSTQTTQTTVPLLDTPQTFDTKANGDLKVPQNKNPQNYSQIGIWQGDNYQQQWVPLVNNKLQDLKVVQTLYNNLKSYSGQDKDRVQALVNSWGHDPKAWQSELIRLNTDQQLGPIHNVTYDTFKQSETPFNWWIKGSLVLLPWVTPLKPTTIPKVPGIIGGTTDGNVVTTEGGDNNTPPFTPTPIESLNPWPTINTSLGNAGNFLRTLATNNKITGLRNQAAAIIPHKGYLPYNYLRQDRQNTLASEGVAGNLRSVGARLGATVDINNRIASGLAAETQAGKIMFEGQKADLDRNTKIATAQLQNNMSVNQYNQNAFDWNNMAVSQGMKEILNNNAQGILANTTAASIYTKQAVKEANKMIDFADMNKMYKASQDPKYQEAMHQYETAASQEAMTAAKAAYDANRATSGGNMPEWEKSKDYQNYMSNLQNLQNRLSPYVNKMQMLQTRQQFQNPFSYAKGGELTYSQKSKLEKQKAENIRRLKEYELFYKMIMQENEMLLKALRS